MPKEIVVVGSLNLDMVAVVNHLPALGETILGLDVSTNCGGKGANQAVAVARLGARVKMVGKLGNDAAALQLRHNIEAAGVDTKHVDAVQGSSGMALITTSTKGENTIIVIPGANHALLPEDIERCRQHIENASIVLSQLEIPLKTIEYLGQMLHSAHVPFLLDPAPACLLPRKLLQSVTWLTPNETEAQSLISAYYPDVHEESAPEVARLLLDLGIRNVVLKLGAKGVYLSGEDAESSYVDSFSVEVVDTTAAGDAFNGAFAFALAHRGMEPRDAAKFACAVAALSVTRSGAQTSMPDLKESKAFLARAIQ